MSGTATISSLMNRPSESPAVDRIDVREAGQVADDRADARAAPASRRQGVPGAAGPAYLERAVPRELEHLPVEQEEPREAEPRDQRQLVVEPLTRALLVAVRSGIALVERAVADSLQLQIGGVDTVGEVGIAVAELLRQVELAAVGDLAGAPSRSRAAGARASHPAPSRTASWLPRRSRSQPSSDVRCLIATSASCSRARARLCACTLPVATVGTPRSAASSVSRAFRFASPRS